MPLLVLLLIGTAVAKQLDPHLVLGVQPSSGEAEIRRAYRAAALLNHPDKNSSAAAQEQFLLVQQAYETLRAGETGSAGGGSDDPFDLHLQRQRGREERRAAWQRFWQQPRPPQRIPSKTEELNSTSFYQRVLLSERSSRAGGGDSRDGAGGAPGLPWLIQVYSEPSPYCRVLSIHWEAAATELAGLAQLGRINFDSQPMLVRFLTSHLRLFSGPHPARELPTVVGFPAGCSSMACARVFRGKFSAAGLRQFAGQQLLRLPPLPAISPRLLAAWRRVSTAAGAGRGGVALLALLPEGPQPLEVLAAVSGARGRLRAAAAAVWRPSDRALWADVGTASAPALVFWQDSTQRPSAIVHGSLLMNSTDWAAAVERHSFTAVPLLTPASASRHLSACSLSTRAAEPLSDALCVLLLGRGAQLTAARASLDTLHAELGRSSCCAKAEQRAAASLLAQGKLQLAWADSGRQRALCRHVMLWSGTSMQQGGSLCEPWWRRQVGALGRPQQQLQPVLVAYRQRRLGSRDGQLLVAAYQGSLEDREELAAWLAALGDVSRQGHLLRPAPLPGVQLVAPADMWPALAALLLRVLHLAGSAELLWQRAASVVGAAAGRVNWRRVFQAALAAGALLGLKWVLDALCGTEDELAWDLSASPQKARRQRRHRSALPGSDAVGSVKEMRASDWEPSPARLLVVLPLHAAGSRAAAQQGQHAQQQFASLAEVFRCERRLAFRVAPVSGALAALLAGGSSGGGHSRPGGEELQQHGQSQGQEGHDLLAPAQAVILHPWRGGRFQLLDLAGAHQAALRLEEVLDGGGRGRQGAAADWQQR